MFEKEPVGASGTAGSALRQAQLIHAALMGGVVIFAAIVASGVVGGGGTSAPAQGGGGGSAGGSLSTAFGILCVLLPVVLIPMALIARRKLMRAAEGMEDPDPVRFQAVVISAAVVESMGLFGCVVWLITGRPLPGAILAGFAVIGMAALFPKRREFENPEDRGGGGEAGGRSFERPETWS